MSTGASTKINKLLISLPPGVVVQSAWLTSQGYNSDLQKRYRKSNWFTAIGTGAMIRTGDDVSLEGGLYALQSQSLFSVHPGGRTALAYLGKAHYLDLSAKNTILFGLRSEHLPKWFTGFNWCVNIAYYPTAFLPPELGLEAYNFNSFTIKISGAIRAIMECLYLAPDHQELMECLQVMESLNNLRPIQVQEMLEGCKSVKVNRLFLFMAEKVGHSWVKYLKTDKIDLGAGKRSIVKNGIYDSKYQITIPEELVDYGK